jgi:hypothetical protein
VQARPGRSRSRCSICAPVRLKLRRRTAGRPRTRAAGRSASVVRATIRRFHSSIMSPPGCSRRDSVPRGRLPAHHHQSGARHGGPTGGGRHHGGRASTSGRRVHAGGPAAFVVFLATLPRLLRPPSDRLPHRRVRQDAQSVPDGDQARSRRGPRSVGRPGCSARQTPD